MVSEIKGVAKDPSVQVDEGDSSSPQPSNFLKIVRPAVLLLLWVQISFSILIVDYSRNVKGEEYSNSDVVMLSEFIKLLISALIILFSGGSLNGEEHVYTGLQTSEARADGVDLEADEGEPELGPSALLACAPLGVYCRLIQSSGKVFFIVVLYAISNIVALTAVEFLGSGVYNTLNQLKVLTTAAFGKICLNREYSSAKWRALLLLVLGCVLVAAPVPDSTDCHENADEVNDLSHSKRSTSSKMKIRVVGLACACVQVSISGFNSAYLESILKTDRCSIWERNFQMSFLSILVLMSTFLFRPSASGFMHQWSWCATAVVLVQSAGGLLVAASLKYADAVIKCFASAMSILFTLLVAYFFLGGHFDLVMFLGCTVTIVSLFNYILDKTDS